MIELSVTLMKAPDARYRVIQQYLRHHRIIYVPYMPSAIRAKLPYCSRRTCGYNYCITIRASHFELQLSHHGPAFLKSKL